MTSNSSRPLFVIFAAALAAAALLASAAARAEESAGALANRLLVEEVVERVARDFYDESGRAQAAAWLEALNKDEWPFDTPPNRPRQTIKTLLDALKVSHVGYFTPDTIDYHELAGIYSVAGLGAQLRAVYANGRVLYRGVGLASKTIGGRTFVADVYDGFPADKAGLRLGDEIVAVDGAPYAEIGSFDDPGKTAAVFTIRRVQDGPTMDVSVPVVDLYPRRMFLEAIRNSARLMERDGVVVGYLRVWAYPGQETNDTIRRMVKNGLLSEADALVIDLRSRWGGTPPDAMTLFTNSGPTALFTSKAGEPIYEFNYRWSKPVVALIDEGTRSSMEIFAAGLKAAGRPLIGERTAGALLGGRGYILQDKSLLVLAIQEVRLDGVLVEGVGVAPDIEVATRVPYANGRDPALERGLEEAVRLAF